MLTNSSEPEGHNFDSACCPCDQEVSSHRGNLSESCCDDVCVRQVNQTLTHKHAGKKKKKKRHITRDRPSKFKNLNVCLECDPQTRALVWWVGNKTAGHLLLLLSLMVSQCVNTLRALRIKCRQWRPFTENTPHRNKWQCWWCSSSEQSVRVCYHSTITLNRLTSVDQSQPPKARVCCLYYTLLFCMADTHMCTHYLFQEDCPIND